MLHTHLFIYHRRYTMFFSKHFSFSCQYHSNNTPYSFIHLTPTLYNVFLPVLPFFPVSFSLPMLHTYSFIYHSRCVIFFSQFSVLPYQIIPPMLHIHSVIYQRSFIIFFSRHFSFPCQYHSTNAPYSFIHLPPTLYNVYLPVLQFPLWVSFHQCSILIHSSTTDAV